MKYTIQVGAFANINNAVRLEHLLDKKGLDAYYFKHRSGLYKVRFGNFHSKSSALKTARRLKSKGIIHNYYIVAPEDYAAYVISSKGTSYIRKQLVKTAKSYIGVPYKWGGTSSRRGFDCSGLTMVVYRVNGLNLPRTSYTQFKTGKYVSKRHLKPGDLVFFDTAGKGRVSHVGIYIGRGMFIHAPGRGKRVKYANLNNSYFRKRYKGARSYL
jgi:cell wall-associated NlpC family hydrolase